MKNLFYFIILFVLIFFLNSCTPQISSNIQTWYDPLEAEQEILVIPSENSKPKDVEILGTASIDAYEYMIECGYEDIVNQAKEKARDIGGNCINITWHLAPSNTFNTCHQIKFEILRLNNRQFQKYAKKYSSTEKDTIIISETKEQELEEKETTSPPSLENNTTIKSDVVSPNLSINSDTEKKKQKKKTFNRNYNKYRLGIAGGYSYQPNVIEPNRNLDYKSHYNELASGNHIAIDAAYFFKEDFAIGLKYSNFTSIASTNNIKWEDSNEKTHIGLMKDYLKVSFYGVSFTMLKAINAKNDFLARMTFGQFNYYNKGIFIKDYLITANTTGVIYDLAYHRILSENFAINLQISLISGKYKNHTIEIDPLIKNSRNNWGREDRINRFDSSIGIIYSW